MIDLFPKEPLLCVLISLFLYLMGFLQVYFLLEGLLKMHRSKTAVKKILKEYTLKQKLWLIPFAEHCLHAARFCRALIRYQRIRVGCMVLFLFYSVLNYAVPISNGILAWFAVGMFVCFDIPLIILHILLDRPLIGKFKEYRFEKYHNTNEREKLF